MPEPLLFGLLLTALAGAAIATTLRPGFEDEIGSLIRRAAALPGARAVLRRQAVLVAAGEPAGGEPSIGLAMGSEPPGGPGTGGPGTGSPGTGGPDSGGQAPADDAPEAADIVASAPDHAGAEPGGDSAADPTVMHASGGQGAAPAQSMPEPPTAAPVADSAAPGAGILHGLGDLLRAAGARLSGGEEEAAGAPPERSSSDADGDLERAGDEPPVGERVRSVARRIFRGEPDALDAVVRALSQAEPSMADRWADLLDRLVAVIRAEALEAGYLDPPRNHAFWVAFTVEQGRDVMKALASLGFRVAAGGGWLDDRAPTRRDLSIAIGYAGVDPVRVRSWPSPEELEVLGRQVTIAAAEYLELVAPGLTLAEVSGAAESTEPRPELAELWREWDRVRPLLLAEG